MSAVPPNCSLYEILQSPCGSSREEVDYVLLSECIYKYYVLLSENISAHLARCHLSKCIEVTEAKLIMARAGIQHLSRIQLEGMTICLRYRHLLGRFWRGPRSCQYPGHTGKVTSVTGSHVITFQIADEVRLIFKEIAAVGSPICSTCRKKHSERLLGLGWHSSTKGSVNLEAADSERATKADARTAIGAHAAEMETTPFRQISTPNRKPFSSPCWTPATPEATFRQIPEAEILGTYNAAMDEVARNIPRKRQPLLSQLVSWEESSPAQRQFYIEKAVEDCMLVCNVIAPNDGETLFHALSSPGGEKDETAEADDLLKSLMTAYKNAKTKSIKIQILMRISTRLAHQKNFTRHMESYLHDRYRERGVMQER
ncbi:unnamed protein product [Pocillopora meandrina]|uniref:Uncharacterized protein n=1 Tax=Pocillopora meandrina TaxID=46732 RepID=A0AAU9X283_9CNID|nr:unnamed protein product [Pocillopora meandrina]